MFAAIYLIFASICFFTLEGLEFMNVFTDGAREYGKYPIGIYGKTLLTICTYLVPFALFQYYPFYILRERRLIPGTAFFLWPPVSFWFLPAFCGSLDCPVTSQPVLNQK